MSNSREKIAYKPGMVLRVHQIVKEMNTKGEEKERIQVYEGTVIAAKHGVEAGATFTVRKISEGVGVEKIFPVHSPVIEKIEVVKQLSVRRAKLNYMRKPEFKRKVKEVKTETKAEKK